MDHVANFLAQFKEAAGEASLLELKARLLADKIPALEPLALKKLFLVEDAILKHFETVLAPAEARTLSACRVLRNKLFHCEFHSARAQLHQLGSAQQSGDVKHIDIRGLAPGDIFAKVGAAADNTPDSFQYVSQMTTQGAGIFGWLLEIGNSGDLVEAARIFRESVTIIDRLFVESVKPN